MQSLDPSLIESWHAHVYFDAATRDAAWALRERIASALAGRMALGVPARVREGHEVPPDMVFGIVANYVQRIAVYKAGLRKLS